MQYFYVLSQGCCLPFTVHDFRGVIKLNIRTASSKAGAHFYCVTLDCFACQYSVHCNNLVNVSNQNLIYSTLPYKTFNSVH